MRDPNVLAQVKATLAELKAKAPGRSVEVRVPPYAAIQCVAGPTHRRGTPPATVEMSAQTWLALASGELAWEAAVARGLITASGQRADLAPFLPL